MCIRDRPTCSRHHQSCRGAASHPISAAKSARFAAFELHGMLGLGILRIVWKARSPLLWLGGGATLHVSPARTLALTPLLTISWRHEAHVAHTGIHVSSDVQRDTSCRVAAPVWLHDPAHDSSRRHRHRLRNSCRPCKASAAPLVLSLIHISEPTRPY